jgi:hypothetical protein
MRRPKTGCGRNLSSLVSNDKWNSGSKTLPAGAGLYCPNSLTQFCTSVSCCDEPSVAVMAINRWPS